MRDLKNAFSPVPSTVHLRVEQTLEEVHEMNLKHHKPIAAVVLAVVLSLALLGGAVAAGGGVLNYLFANDKPTQQQQSLVQSIGVSHAGSDVTTTVTDAIFDGRRLDAALTFDTQLPLYAVLDGAWFNGQEVTNTDGWLHNWVNDPSASEKSLAATGISVILDDRIDGPVEVRLRLLLLTPEKQVEAINFAVMSEKQADEAFYSCTAKGNTPIYAQGVQHGIYLPTDVYAQYAATPSLDAAGRDACTRAYLEAANMRLVEEAEMTFTVETVDTCVQDIGWMVSQKGESPFRVDVVKADFTPMSTHIVVDVYPTVHGMTQEELTNLFISHWTSIYDEKKEKVPFQAISGAGSSSGEQRKDTMGNWYIRLEWEEGPIEGEYEKLYLVPCQWPDGAEKETPFWNYAIELVVTDHNNLNG